MNGWEIFGFITGALSVWWAVRQNVWTWPIGIANSAAWLILFTQSRLYTNAGLQVVYILLGLWGWIWWCVGGADRSKLIVSRTRRAEAFGILVFCILGGIALFAWQRTTDNVAPFWDTATTIISLAATWLLARKKLANWVLWIMVDITYTVLYTNQHLYLTAALQPLFAIMCVIGWRDWRRELSREAAPGNVRDTDGPVVLDVTGLEMLP